MIMIKIILEGMITVTILIVLETEKINQQTRTVTEVKMLRRICPALLTHSVLDPSLYRFLCSGHIRKISLKFLFEP